MQPFSFTPALGFLPGERCLKCEGITVHFIIPGVVSFGCGVSGQVLACFDGEGFHAFPEKSLNYIGNFISISLNMVERGVCEALNAWLFIPFPCQHFLVGLGGLCGNFLLLLFLGLLGFFAAVLGFNVLNLGFDLVAFNANLLRKHEGAVRRVVQIMCEQWVHLGQCLYQPGIIRVVF